MFAKFICWFFAPLFTSKTFLDAVSARFPVPEINLDDLAKRVNADSVALRLADRVIDQVDMTEISQKVAHLFSASDIAEFIDTDAIADHMEVDADKVAESIDMSELVEAIDKDNLADRVCEHMSKAVDYSKLAEEVDMSNLCENLDYSELASNLELDYSELASNIEASDIAGEITVDYSDLADEIDYSKLVEEGLDYEELAGHIGAKSVASHCTKQINNAVYDYLSNGEDMIDYKALAKAIIKELATPKVEVRYSPSESLPSDIHGVPTLEVNA